MLLRLQKFDLTVSCRKGSEMLLADTLSLVHNKRPEADTFRAEEVLCVDDNLKGETEREVEDVMIQFLPVTEAIHIAIQTASELDDN